MSSDSRELIIKGVRFIVIKNNDDYEIKAYYEPFKTYTTFARVFTLAKCKERAREFINKGGWEGWMV